MTPISRQSGTACVELALCLPLIGGCFLMALDIARAYRLELALQDAVRCGILTGTSRARSEADPSVWEDHIRDAVVQRLRACSASAAANHQCQIEFDLAEAWTTVNVTVPFKLLVDWPLLPGEYMVSSSLTSQRFR